MSRYTKAELNNNKNLIITLIQADLKHNQLIGNLRELEIHTEAYFLPLYKAIAHLMGLGEAPHPQWFDIYDHYLINVHTHPISANADSLLSVAEECYHRLCASIK